jgi:hypothetical protein
MENYFVSFMLGGIIVSLTSYFSVSTSHNRLASLIWSIPTSIFIIIYYMNKSGLSNYDISKFLKKTSMSVILTVLYLFILSKLIKHTNKLMYSIVIASIFWLFCAFVFYQIN